MDNPTNRIIQIQLQDQKKFHNNNLYGLGKEDFLVIFKDGNLNIHSNNEPNLAQQTRLDLIVPYIANFIQTYNLIMCYF